MMCHPPHTPLFLLFLLLLLFTPALVLSAVPTSSLGTAYSSASSEEIIVLSPGSTYIGQCASDSSTSLCLTKSITLKCLSYTTKCTLDGGSSRTVGEGGGYTKRFFFEGLIITRGSALSGTGFENSGAGGGLSLNDCYAMISGCTFESNSAVGNGGGMMLVGEYQITDVYDTTFRLNSAQFGGGVYMLSRSTMTLVSCTFTSNSVFGSMGGGAIFWNDITLIHLYGTSFTNNVYQQDDLFEYSGDGNAIIDSKCPAGFATINPCIISGPNIVASATIVGQLRNYCSCGSPCPAGTYRAVSGAACQNCPAGSYLSDASSTAYSSTLHDSSSDCVVCEAGRYTAAGSASSSCVACKPGKFIADDGQVAAQHTAEEFCLICPGGKYNADLTGVAYCASCAAGTYLEDAATAAAFHDELADCVRCQAGKYSTVISSTSSTTCLPCLAGQTSSLTGAGCVPCLAGSYSDQDAAPTCTTCPAGTFVSATNAKACDKCQKGKYNDDDGVDLLRHNANNDCYPCQPGLYNDVEGAIECKTCPEGTTSLMQAIICGNCPPGYSCKDGAGQTACEPGSYSNGDGICRSCDVGYKCPGGSDRVECSPGTITSSPSSIECLNCVPGRFNPDSAKDECRICPAGYFCPLGVAAPVECGSVSLFCPEGSGIVRVVGAGYYSVPLPKGLLPEGASITNTRYDQRLCEVGSACVGGEKRSCIAGEDFQSSEGKSSCLSCSLCLLGQGDIKECNVFEDTRCEDCPIGKFSYGGSSGCEDCPSGYHSDAGASECKRCLTGKYFDSAVNDCLACELGKYSEKGGECYECQAGFITKEKGAGYCAPCPQFQVNDPTDLSNCKCDRTFVFHPSHYGKSECTCPPGEMLIGTCCEKCSEGKFKTIYGIDACQLCDSYYPGSTTVGQGATNATDCICPSTQYMKESEGLSEKCVPVPPGVDTNSDTVVGGMTLFDLALLPGYWRISSTTHDIRKCFTADACLGGQNQSEYCRSGHHGPYCNLCNVGYRKNVVGLCERCRTTSENIGGTVGVFILSAVLLFAGFCAWNRWIATRGKFAKAIVSGVKIIFVSYQVLATLPTIVPNLTLPDNLSRFLSSISIFKLNLFQFVSFQCIKADYNYYDTTLSMTLIPVCLLVPILLFGATVGKRFKVVKRRCSNIALALTYIALPTVTTVVFGLFPCDDFNDGTGGKAQLFLRADYGISCDSEQYKIFLVFGVINVILYPILIPAIYSLLLFRKRDRINQPIAIRELDDSVLPLTFLFEAYQPQFWWFEIFETYRRLALTGALAAVQPGSVQQLVVGILLAFGGTVVYSVFLPYINRHNNFLAVLSNIQVFMIMLISLMLRYKIETKNDNAYTIGVLLILLNVLGILSLLVLAIYRMLHGVDDDIMLAESKEGEGEGVQSRTKTSSFNSTNPFSLFTSLASGSFLEVTRGRSNGRISEGVCGLQMSDTELNDLRRQASTVKPIIRSNSKSSSSNSLGTSSSARLASDDDGINRCGKGENEETDKEKQSRVRSTSGGVLFTQTNPMAGSRKNLSKTLAAAGEKQARHAADGVGREKDDAMDYWEKVTDPATGSDYYFHKVTNEVRWDRPKDYKGDA